MIIESIRLRNIKSYGEGPEGRGTLVRFKRGVNRVAGRNGHGKTTIIESIGYALFLTEPDFEERFEVETYFLSHGAKEGDIEVTFHAGGETYRVERPLGKASRRRRKVVLERDGSICAEDREVEGFLCRLLNFPDAARLSEVFCKLVGIKQGRLTWPFDSKPSEAKAYFEPLFGVEVFRQCFERLKGATNVLKEERQSHEIAAARVQTVIAERADAAERLTEAEVAIKSGEGEMQKAQAAFLAANNTKEALEQAEARLRTADRELAQAKQADAHAVELRKTAESDLAAAEAALATLSQNQAAYDAHAQAMEALVLLERKREEREALKEQRERAHISATSEQHKADAAREHNRLLLEQNVTRRRDSEAEAAAAAELRRLLDDHGPAFNKAAEETDTAETEVRVLSKWVAGITAASPNQTRTMQRIAQLSGILGKSDPSKLADAEARDAAAEKALREADRRYNAAAQEQATLQQQLGKISGGVCPFLKETCRQFDAAKVKADVETNAANITALASALSEVKLARSGAAEALELQRNTSNHLKAQRDLLQESVENYSIGVRSAAPPERILSAVAWLRKSHAELSEAPAAPADFALQAANVESLHPQFEAFVNETNAWCESAGTAVNLRKQSFAAEREKRHGNTLRIGEHEKAMARLAGEIAFSAKQATLKASEAARHHEQAEAHGKEVRTLDEQLKDFSGLDEELRREQQRRDTNKEGHQKFLQAKALADDLPARKDRVTFRIGNENAAREVERACAAAFQTAVAEFDQDKLKKTKAECEARREEVATWRVRLTQAAQDAERERNRVAEHETARREQEIVASKIGRCAAAIDVIGLARTTLRDSAPAVAQSLCDRIASHAQRVFNQINPEPVELLWDAERYSLRIAPGERRFAMLSGGEQTKLALAMTLAMIEEFSGLRFCVFDEPTYGVDADSRQKLADSILEAQNSAGLDQLLLVSHDDAFEGKIEHSIILEKTAAAGTQIAG
jgi:DNA repair protein SbcC/Rad50